MLCCVNLCWQNNHPEPNSSTGILEMLQGRNGRNHRMTTQDNFISNHSIRTVVIDIRAWAWARTRASNSTADIYLQSSNLLVSCWQAYYNIIVLFALSHDTVAARFQIDDTTDERFPIQLLNHEHSCRQSNDFSPFQSLEGDFSQANGISQVSWL